MPLSYKKNSNVTTVNHYECRKKAPKIYYLLKNQKTSKLNNEMTKFIHEFAIVCSKILVQDEDFLREISFGMSA